MITSTLVFSPEYSTNMAKIGLWLGVCFTISSHEHSTDFAMGLDMCDSNITGFQSASVFTLVPTILPQNEILGILLHFGGSI